MPAKPLCRTCQHWEWEHWLIGECTHPHWTYFRLLKHRDATCEMWEAAGTPTEATK